MNIDERYSRALDRRSLALDRELGKVKEYSEEFIGKHLKYIIAAMAPVAQLYTDQLIEQGNRIENALAEPLSRSWFNLDYRRQGSVSNNTHIRKFSDADVLVIINKFVWKEDPLPSPSPYQGDWRQEFLDLRRDCKKTLAGAFPAAEIDDSGATSLKISGGSLKCAVDVVPAGWADTVEYVNNNDEIVRGIRVYNKNTRATNKNFPFLFNALLRFKDEKHSGAPKALIRLLKTLKADISEEQNYDWRLSSYDICSIVYRMNDEAFLHKNYPAAILASLLSWIVYLDSTPTVRDSLKVIDNTRSVFDSEEKKADLRKLKQDILYLLSSVQEESGFSLHTAVHL